MALGGRIPELRSYFFKIYILKTNLLMNKSIIKIIEKKII